MIKEAIAALVEGRDLTFGEAGGAMEDLMTGTATPAQAGSFLAALRFKGETVDEIAGLAKECTRPEILRSLRSLRMTSGG